MDAGVAAEANLQWLKEQNYRYLVVSRKRHVEWDEAFSQIVRAQGTNEVRIYSKNSADGEEVELYCCSSSRATKEVAMDALFQQCFEEQIHALADGLTKKGCAKQYDKVLQRVGRLQEKCCCVRQTNKLFINVLGVFSFQCFEKLLILLREVRFI